MLLDGALCNASALVNGADIDFVPLAEMEERTTFYHIELDHAILIDLQALVELCLQLLVGF